MKISEVAKYYQVSKRTLRYYEEIGLLISYRKSEREERWYEKAQIERLEQILLLKKIGLPLKKIEDVLLRKDIGALKDILRERLKTVEEELCTLHIQKELVGDMLQQMSQDTSHPIHFYDLIKEQIYLKNYMRQIEGMKYYMKDMIILEFGEELIESVVAEELPKKVGILKEQIMRETNTTIPLIRMRDNLELGDKQYRTLIKEVVVQCENVERCEEAVPTMLKTLERAIKQNLELLE